MLGGSALTGGIDTIAGRAGRLLRLPDLLVIVFMAIERFYRTRGPAALLANTKAGVGAMVSASGAAHVAHAFACRRDGAASALTSDVRAAA